MNSHDLAIWSILVALTAAGLVPVVRQVPAVQDWMFKGIKPWVCDLCMSFWGTVVATAFWWLWSDAPTEAMLPAFALTFYIVRKNGDPTGPAPSLPELEDTGGN